MNDLTLVIPAVVRAQDEFWRSTRGIKAFREVLRRLTPCTSVKRLLVCSDSRVFKNCAEGEGASFVQMPLTTELEPPHLGPPGRRNCTKHLIKLNILDESAVMVNFRCPDLSAAVVDAAVEAWGKEKGRLMTVRKSEDHPCQLFSHSRIGDVGYLTLKEASPGSLDRPRLFRDETGTCSLTVAAPGQACIFLEEEVVPHGQTFSLQLWWENNEGMQEVRIENVVAGTPFALPEAAPEGERVRYVLECVVDSGEYDICNEYPYGKGLWSLDRASKQVRNLETGKIIRGRQDFPDVFEPDDAILIGAVTDLVDWDRCLEKGRVKPFEPQRPLGLAVCNELDYLRSLSAKALA